MTFRQALSQAKEILTINDIEDALLESELLLRHTLNISRVQLYQDLGQELDSKQEQTFWNLIKRRLGHEPTAYITGHREFFGLDFYVNPHVLIPRPESELLVEMVLTLAQHQNITTIADIGTGCGAIAISLASNLPQTKIYATDISTSALEVALINCRRHGVVDRIHLLHGDLLNPLPDSVDLIIANLPYVKKDELPQRPKSFEPLLALDGGFDGLQTIRQLCYQVNNKLKPEGHLFLEIGQGQGSAIMTLLSSLFSQAKIETVSDFSGIDRVISLYLSRT